MLLFTVFNKGGNSVFWNSTFSPPSGYKTFVLHLSCFMVFCSPFTETVFICILMKWLYNSSELCSSVFMIFSYFAVVCMETKAFTLPVSILWVERPHLSFSSSKSVYKHHLTRSHSRLFTSCYFFRTEVGLHPVLVTQISCIQISLRWWKMETVVTVLSPS